MSKTEVLPNDAALVDLAERINTEHEACHASMQKGLDHALKAGALLLEAKEAEQLEDEARRDETMMHESLACDIEEDHGSALHYVETWDYVLDDEQWGVLQSKQHPEDAAAYIREVGSLKTRGWWGDLTLQAYSANGPIHSDPIGGTGWNGWGGSDWLAEFFPDGLAPKAAQA